MTDLTNTVTTEETLPVETPVLPAVQTPVETGDTDPVVAQ